jgi:hypothetical protein
VPIRIMKLNSELEPNTIVSKNYTTMNFGFSDFRYLLMSHFNRLDLTILYTPCEGLRQLYALM